MTCSTSGLIIPKVAFVLVPERPQGTFTTKDSQKMNVVSPNFSDILMRTINANALREGLKLIAVTWLTLLLEPEKQMTVVAAVLPTTSQVLGETIKSPIFAGTECSRKRHIVECLPCVQQWDLSKLPNLKVLIVVPWPDPADELLSMWNDHWNVNRYKTIKMLLTGDSITVGTQCCRDCKCYINLNDYVGQCLKIFFAPNMFLQSTSELALTLMSAVSRGCLKESESRLKHWMQAVTRSQPEAALEEYSVQILGITQVQLKQELLNYKQTRSSVTTANKSSATCNPEGTEKETKNDVNITAARLPRSLFNARLGMIGMSTKLAKKIAQMATYGLGMKIAYHQQHPIPGITYYYYNEMEDLLRVSDVVMLADDSITDTFHWSQLPGFGRANFRKKNRPNIWLSGKHFTTMQPNALLVCVTTTQCIDFEALAVALRCHQVAGAGITIPTCWFTSFSQLDALRTLPNTFILPPATSSAISIPGVRIRLAEHIVLLIKFGVSGESTDMYSKMVAEREDNEDCHNQSNRISNSLSMRVFQRTWSTMRQTLLNVTNRVKMLTL